MKGRWVQRHLATGLTRNLQCLIHLAERGLELQHHKIRVTEQTLELCLRHPQLLVRSGHHHDLVLAGIVHADHRHTRRCITHLLHMRHIDAIAAQGGQQLCAISVLTHAREQAHCCALPRTTHGLIATLATGHMAQVVA